MSHPIKTPTVEAGVNDQQFNKSESLANYTKSSLTYKELCDSIKNRSKEDVNEYKF
jgi:hypothetical protein